MRRAPAARGARARTVLQNDTLTTNPLNRYESLQTRGCPGLKSPRGPPATSSQASSDIGHAWLPFRPPPLRRQRRGWRAFLSGEP